MAICHLKRWLYCRRSDLWVSRSQVMMLSSCSSNPQNIIRRVRVHARRAVDQHGGNPRRWSSVRHVLHDSSTRRPRRPTNFWRHQRSNEWVQGRGLLRRCVPHTGATAGFPLLTRCAFYLGSAVMVSVALLVIVRQLLLRRLWGKA